jgi:hypothetical protein
MRPASRLLLPWREAFFDKSQTAKAGRGDGEVRLFPRPLQGKRCRGPRRRGGLVCETRAGASSSRPKAEPATEGRRFLSLSKGGDLAEASRREQFRQRCEAVLRPELRQKKCRRYGPSGKFNCSVQAAPGGRRGGGVQPSRCRRCAPASRGAGRRRARGTRNPGLPGRLRRARARGRAC